MISQLRPESIFYHLFQCIELHSLSSYFKQVQSDQVLLNKRGNDYIQLRVYGSGFQSGSPQEIG